MDVTRILRLIACIIIAVCIPLILLSASLGWGFNSHWLYVYGFDKYAVSETTGLSSADLDKTAGALIDYFNNGETYIQVEVEAGGRTIQLFNDEEQVHFKDVKDLVRLDYRVFFISLIVLVLMVFMLARSSARNGVRNVLKSIFTGCLLSIVIIFALGLGSWLDFDALFLQFHYLAFTNMFWSASGYMLLLFPGGFWYDAAFICIAFMASLAVVIGAVCLVLVRSLGKLNKR